MDSGGGRRLQRRLRNPDRNRVPQARNRNYNVTRKGRHPVTTPVPFDRFAAELSAGERIEWTGQPNPRVILHAEDWAAIPFSLMWGGFAIFWLLGASGLLDIWKHRPDRTFQYFGLIWGTPFVLVGQYLIWGRFAYAAWKKRRTYYAITGNRALIVQDGLRGRRSTSVRFSDLSLIDKRVRADGIGTISFGAPVTGQWQWGRGNPPRPPSFDDIDNAESVYQQILRLQEQSRKSSAFTNF